MTYQVPPATTITTGHLTYQASPVATTTTIDHLTSQTSFVINYQPYKFFISNHQIS